MWTGQSYIVRLLREVERWLIRNGHAAEGSQVGRIVQKLAQADDVHEALEGLYHVEGFDAFALRLMWHSDLVERGILGLENGSMEYCAAMLGGLLVSPAVNPRDIAADMSFPEKIDQISVLQYEIGRVIGEIKRRSIGPDGFKEIEEGQLGRLHRGLAMLGEQAASAGRKDLVRLAAACSSFVQYVIDHGLLRDVRVVNILDTVNLTLQTEMESMGVEDHSSFESMIELLHQPKDLLD